MHVTLRHSKGKPEVFTFGIFFNGSRLFCQGSRLVITYTHKPNTKGKL